MTRLQKQKLSEGEQIFILPFVAVTFPLKVGASAFLPTENLHLNLEICASVVKNEKALSLW